MLTSSSLPRPVILAFVSFVLVSAWVGSAGWAAEQVEEAWVARYDGAGSADEAAALAVDALGNVHVTGSSNDPDTGWHYATVKYDTDGNRLWAAVYDSPEQDTARALALDAAGNVHVTGNSATVKYDPRGNELWAAPGHGEAGPEWGRALAVDPEGNVCVTGSADPSDPPGDRDYVTVKYDRDGTELWVARHPEDDDGTSPDEARAIAVDSEGNVYVTGSSQTSRREDYYATVKYDPQGSRIWLQAYDGAPGEHDRAYALAIDASGNVYVTGVSKKDYATVKYSPEGQQIWEARTRGPDILLDPYPCITLDGRGNTYVAGARWRGYPSTGGMGYDYLTVQYDGDGNEGWVKWYDAPEDEPDAWWEWWMHEWIRAVAVDDLGNVYVTGRSWGGDPGAGGTGRDYLTMKYDPEGNEVWKKRFGGNPSGDDHAVALGVDEEASIYVAGTSEGQDTGPDFVTVKYVHAFPFVRGDADASGRINLSDGLVSLNWLFLGGPRPRCLDAADVDDSGSVNLTDATRIFNWLFMGGPAPLPPSPSDADYLSNDCGEDTTPDSDGDLGCRRTSVKCR